MIKVVVANKFLLQKYIFNYFESFQKYSESDIFFEDYLQTQIWKNHLVIIIF